MCATGGDFLRRLVDAWVLRRPFEGPSARRYRDEVRPAFGDFDDRVLARLATDLATARGFLEVGGGVGVFAARVAREHADLAVLALEPSADFTTRRRPVGAGGAVPGGDRSTHATIGARDSDRGTLPTLRALAEDLPLASASVDVALCLSSLRHVADRVRALHELRRVVRPGGSAWIIELDPAASAERIARHRDALGSRFLRLTFAPFFLGVCPPAEHFIAAARAAGWSLAAHHADEEQPFYFLRLS